MTDVAVRTSVLGRFYSVTTDADGSVALSVVDEPLNDVAVVDGRLLGPDVVVDTRAVVVKIDRGGDLVGDRVEPLELRDGSLCFDPSQGGVRARENRRACGAFNAIVAEANGFGMVNAFVHTSRAADFANRLLHEVGAPRLPQVGVIVGAHFGSNLPGYAQGDGSYWSGRLRPLSGGHYRLSARTTGVPELFPVSPTGEVHLGPKRYRRPFAGSSAYLGNAAHNPAIIYHEFGHHLCRHTADFRLNGERASDEQRNGKTALEEGICDYFAAVLLESGRPYGWYRPRQGERRDVESLRSVDEVDRTDPHTGGATWASALWRCRRDLVDKGFLAEPIDHDRAVVQSLVAIGEVAGPDDGRSLLRRERVRSRASTMSRAYRAALKERGGSQAAREARRILERSGIVSPKEPQAIGTPC